MGEDRAAMTKSSKVCLVAAAIVAVWKIRQPTFLPPMGRMMAPAAGVAALGAAPAFADEIGDAAKKLAEASYPFAKEVDWNNGIYLHHRLSCSRIPEVLGERWRRRRSLFCILDLQGCGEEEPGGLNRRICVFALW